MGDCWLRSRRWHWQFPVLSHPCAWHEWSPALFCTHPILYAADRKLLAHREGMPMSMMRFSENSKTANADPKQVPHYRSQQLVQSGNAGAVGSRGQHRSALLQELMAFGCSASTRQGGRHRSGNAWGGPLLRENQRGTNTADLHCAGWSPTTPVASC